MKAIAFAATLAATLAFAHATDAKGADGKDASSSRASKTDKVATHATRGTVKKADAKNGSVTLAHEPVKSLNWPSMTMAFKVDDKALLQKLEPGKTVEVEFQQRGRDYVITSAK